MLLPKLRRGNQEEHLRQRFSKVLGELKKKFSVYTPDQWIWISRDRVQASVCLVHFGLSSPRMKVPGLVPFVKIDEPEKEWSLSMWNNLAIWEADQEEGHRQRGRKDTNLRWCQETWWSRRSMAEVDPTCMQQVLEFKPIPLTPNGWRTPATRRDYRDLITRRGSTTC